jgi:hypothetical protein
MGLNLLPFVCVCFALNKNTHRDIDNIYTKRKNLYEQLILESPLSKSNLMTEHSLMVEDYAKKVLGIMIHLSSFSDYTSEDYLDVANGWEDILSKHFPLVSRFAEKSFKKKELSVKDFVNYFIRKSKKHMSFNVDSLNSQIAVLLYIANNVPEIEIKDEDEFHIAISMLYKMTTRAEQIDNTHIKNNKPNDTEKAYVKKLMKRVDNITSIKIRDYDTLNHALSLFDFKTDYDWEGLLYDLEGITDSFVYDVKISELECEELLYIFYLENVNRIDSISDIELFNFYTSALRHRLVLKSYKMAKDYYFKNAYDLTSMINLENEVKSLKSEVTALKQEKDKLIMQLEREERKSKRLEKEFEEINSNKKELVGLRDYFFNSHTDYIPPSDNLKIDKVLAIVGGHEKWQNKIKNLIQNTIIIHTDNLNQDLKILLRADAVVFYPNYLNHAMYFKVIDYADKNNIPVFYLNNLNETIVLKELNFICTKLNQSMH